MSYHCPYLRGTRKTTTRKLPKSIPHRWRTNETVRYLSLSPLTRKTTVNLLTLKLTETMVDPGRKRKETFTTLVPVLRAALNTSTGLMTTPVTTITVVASMGTCEDIPLRPGLSCNMTTNCWFSLLDNQP